MKLHVVMYDNHVSGERKWHVRRSDNDKTIAVVNIAYERLANAMVAVWNAGDFKPTPEEVGLLPGTD